MHIKSYVDQIVYRQNDAAKKARIVEASCMDDLRLQAKQWTFSIPVNNEIN